MEDKCVSCGAVIPEGRQVCPQCEKGPVKKAELKPCPFCGSEASIKHYASKELFRKQPQYSYVQCNGCNIRTELAYTDAEVSYKWNRRAEDVTD